jgi:hypothetical protein
LFGHRLTEHHEGCDLLHAVSLGSRRAQSRCCRTVRHDPPRPR